MPLPPSHGEFDWTNVRGWLTEPEGNELSRLAKDKVVLEIGTFCGRSTLAMVKTARKVFCLDTFAGYAEPGMGNTLNEALCNFDRSEHRDKIVIIKGRQEDVLPTMDLSEIGLVFYDADHSEQSTARGIRLLEAAGLPETAAIAFHDYHDLDPGVVRAVDSWCIPRGKAPRVVDSLAVFDCEEQARQERAPSAYDVMLAIPTNGQTLVYGAAQGLFRATWRHHVQINHYDKSLLAACFNKLWCDGLNAAEKGDVTHVAFLHADIAPADGWIDTLIEEMERHEASLCSAVSPVKDPRGLTSTGIGEPGLAWSPLQRFATAEVMEFPETFDADAAGNPGKVLLLNSGCWVADLRDPRFFHVDQDGQAKVFFTINDRVVKTDGVWVHQVESEDWFFSRCLHEQGIRAVATRKVPIVHLGLTGFRNDVAWGTQECDEDLKPLWQPAKEPAIA